MNNATRTVPAVIADDHTELQSLTDQQLIDQLHEAVGVTVSRLVRIAAIVRVLEDRGVNLKQLKLGMLAHVRRIAHGQLLPDAVVRFLGQPLLLRKISEMPVPDQRTITQADHVEIADPVTGDTRRVPPTDLGRNDIWQLIGANGMRDPDEQMSYVRSTAPKKYRVNRPDASGVKLDRKKGGIVVGDEFISRSQLARYLSDLG